VVLGIGAKWQPGKRGDAGKRIERTTRVGGDEPMAMAMLCLARQNVQLELDSLP
jgi:hypothetical protein